MRQIHNWSTAVATILHIPLTRLYVSVKFLCVVLGLRHVFSRLLILRWRYLSSPLIIVGSRLATLLGICWGDLSIDALNSFLLFFLFNLIEVRVVRVLPKGVPMRVLVLNSILLLLNKNIWAEKMPVQRLVRYACVVEATECFLLLDLRENIWPLIL